MQVLEMMAVGAATLAEYGFEHTPKHAAIGFSDHDWRLLTQAQPWSGADRRKMPAIISEAFRASFSLAQLPPAPLPVQYAAAVLVKLVHPCNLRVAIHCCPDTHDVLKAINGGLQKDQAPDPASKTELEGYCLQYLSGYVTGFPKPLYGEQSDDDKVVTQLEMPKARPQQAQ